MRYIITIIIVIVIAIILFATGGEDVSGCSIEEHELLIDKGLQDETGVREGYIAPDFAVVNYDCDVIKLSDFRGTPVFVNFWATWCLFCIEEMPLMARFQQEFGDQYVTLAVNRGEGLEDAQNYTDNILDIAGTMQFVIDNSDRIYRDYGALGMPYSVFIDANGEIVSIVRGPLNEQSLRSNINNIINN